MTEDTGAREYLPETSGFLFVRDEVEAEARLQRSAGGLAAPFESKRAHARSKSSNRRRICEKSSSSVALARLGEKSCDDSPLQNDFGVLLVPGYG